MDVDKEGRERGERDAKGERGERCDEGQITKIT
jgi:hypothetical protein